MKLSLYRMGTTLGGPLIRLYLNHRLKRGKEDPARFQERLGHPSLPRPSGKVVWMHAASVGEALSVLALVERVLAEYPGWSVLVTTGTVTSARLMAQRLPQGAVHQYVPVDRVSYVRRFLEHWRPDLALWVESEFWPNMVIETRASAIPMVVLNGRMSEKSFNKWRKSPAMIARLLAAFPLILAQSAQDGERFHKLGAKNVDVVGNLKFAAKPLPVDDEALAKLKTVIGTRPVWLAASTHDGEEAICGRVHTMLKVRKPDLLTIIAPRHPERGTVVAAELTAQGLNVARRANGDAISTATDVYIADTLGELGLFYRLCKIVFMGKTLASGGGQNPIEPSALSCALIFGKDMSNFQDISSTLVKTGAARWVADETELCAAVEMLMNDEKARETAAISAFDTARAEAGVLDRVLHALAPYFQTVQANPAAEEAHHART
ncbi:3-deoxy-D-manno-octulosonic acid transferase [Magnetovibrio sp.]|uniref:3-deoxy-D-manno-octulosonic acid transferase n=1 Tax=Magnetovibrio sp. TaxID=2024836 RepID=UPI002F946BD7